MMSETIQKAINAQINSELSASYSYLAMSAYCDGHNFTGSAQWLRLQSQEEYAHAMKLVDFVLARGARVELGAIEQPRQDYASLLDVFQTALGQEQAVSAKIEALYELAFKERAYPAAVQLEWFLTEQIEEEKTCRSVVARLQMVGNDASSILDIDRELGARAPEASGGA